MKLGDRIRVFEITKQDPELIFIKGLQRPEIDNSGIRDGVPMLLISDVLGANVCFLDSKQNKNHTDSDCRHVATMVITKVKS